AMIFSYHWSIDLCHLHSFPTRRSSDLTAENIAIEVAFFHDPNNRSFERTYGWAWLLKLSEALHFANEPRLKALEAHLQPLTDLKSEEHTSELQSRENLVCRLLLEKKND